MATNALADGFRTYLEGCSEETAAQIISVLQQAGRNAASSAVHDMAASGLAVAKTEKKPRKKANSGVGGGPKRPLNSWMAFRKYYNAMLAPNTQKAISKVLTVLWREDPFEAKWAILAKAYSIVRGSREKKEAPLDDFFTHCAPLIGVVPPEKYLQLMGWQLGPALEGSQEKIPQITRLHTPNLDTFPEEFTTTTLSVDDLVNYCFEVGYVSASNSGSPNTSTQDSLTMVSMPTAITTDDMDAATYMTTFAQADAILTFTADTFNSSTEEEHRQVLFNNPVGPPSTPAGQATLEQATRALENSGVDYPYSALFDPASEFDVSFDPVAPDTEVEDEGRWDAFDPSTTMAQNEGDEMVSALDEMLNMRWEAFTNGRGMF